MQKTRSSCCGFTSCKRHANVSRCSSAALAHWWRASPLQWWMTDGWQIFPPARGWQKSSLDFMWMVRVWEGEWGVCERSLPVSSASNKLWKVICITLKYSITPNDLVRRNKNRRSGNFSRRELLFFPHCFLQWRLASKTLDLETRCIQMQKICVSRAAKMQRRGVRMQSRQPITGSAGRGWRCRPTFTVIC